MRLPMRRGGRRSAGLLVAGALVAGLLPAVAEAAPPTVDWTACKPGAPQQCGKLTVPLDWSKPAGAKTEVLVARIPAKDQAHKVGVLAFNPGGPGGAGASIIAEGYADQLFPQWRDKFDIVSWDPRGTGGSTQLDCGTILRPGVPVFPRSKAQYDAMVASSRAFGEQCLKQHGDLMRNLDTRAAARDLDALRAALGVDKLNYFGPSYGSFVGTTYAQLFPHRINRMVLDGILDHAAGPTAFMLTEARQMEYGFNRFAAWCRIASSCALHGRDVGKVYDEVVRKADKKPLPGTPYVKVSGDTIRMSLPVLIPAIGDYVTPWTELAAALAAAEKGDGSGFIGRSYVGDPESAYAAVSCLDFPPGLTSYADAKARLALAKAVAPRVGAAVEGWAITAACAGWPIPPTNPWQPTPVDDAPPILIAGNTHDPSTPLESARGLHRQLRGSHLMVTDVYGHTSWFNSECARSRITKYLETGEMPPERPRCS
ncbi:alpha/beta hydrolase [Kribbella monticola]|uniref:alpha/beta hydrolase n=1 Tax=Kribbella monticola TaxID=2185285 RepID=UPI000DD49676|nr:alpha/beta hydrolase [Kribbella monticola]